ncbi:ceramidase domain-containing protein [Rhodomicrobium lacus]|uniref:ceramidase domain-containing protein n=1 Tax=Rhodomicrobium lacus TaxID=2498452 RepID=UPI0026E16583|nr:ceramidase domain-containing protein [Rhodomicrobium lacus]WKW51654.1 ceramidase domain-containing protein [Rhodomicrobium lacus]
MQGATIFAYCERGMSPAFWAEPLNAITNAAFVAAGIAGAVMIARQTPAERSAWSVFFALNFVAIGIGSFLFHTVPNPTTGAADTIPIGIFMLTYLIFALRRFAGAGVLLTASMIALFVGAMALSGEVQCYGGRIGFGLAVPEGARAACLNGGLAYGPAVVALVLIAGTLAIRRHRAAALVFAAAVTFTVSLTFRTLDPTLCADFTLFGYRLGTHFLWHLLNATTLWLLLLASIRYSRQSGNGTARRIEIIPPRPALLRGRR